VRDPRLPWLLHRRLRAAVSCIPRLPLLGEKGLEQQLTPEPTKRRTHGAGQRLARSPFLHAGS